MAVPQELLADRLAEAAGLLKAAVEPAACLAEALEAGLLELVLRKRAAEADTPVAAAEVGKTVPTLHLVEPVVLARSSSCTKEPT